MPLDEKGEVYLTFWHGMFVWLCVAVWMLGWGMLGAVLVEFAGWKIVGYTIIILGQGSFGLVPAFFFIREENRCKNERRKEGCAPGSAGEDR